MENEAKSDEGGGAMRPRRVPKERIPYLDNLVADLNKKAAKLGCAPVGYRVIGEYVERRAVDRYEPDRVRLLKPDEMPRDHEEVRVRLFVEVEPFGDAPKINGWAFAARIEHHGDAGNVVNRNPRFDEEVPARFREGGPVCEHCKLKRNRHDSFVLKSDAGGWIQVGRDCLADFLGHKDPEALIAAAEFLERLCGAMDADEEGGGGGGGGPRYADLDQVLRVAAACIRLDGWMSQARAEAAFKSSTANDVGTVLFAKRGGWSAAMVAWAHERDGFDERDVAAGKAAREWALALPDGCEYESNLRVIARVGYVERVGLAVSMVAAHQRAMNQLRDRERPNRKPSEFQGVVGERKALKLTVERVFVLESMYGRSYLHLLRDENDNVFKWKASNERLDEGKWYRGPASVKAHDVYKGKGGDVNQTVLSRCKFTECEADAPAEEPKAKKPRKAKKQPAEEPAGDTKEV